MAFDPNSIPSNLHPINIARTLPDEPRISPVTISSANSNPSTNSNPSISRENSPGGSIPLFYPSTVPDSGGYVYAPALANWLPRMPVPVGVNPNAGYSYSPSAGLRVDPGYGAPSVAGSASDEGGDDSVSGRKVKFLCSFGGKILPRPSDGALRYVGGNTRIISVRREVGFNELVQKMFDSYGQNVVIKYQLPDEDLDALVSVSGPDDLDNMMDEYDKLVERSSDGSAKLRVFLFLASELESSSGVRLGDFQDSGQRYVEAVNGVSDGVGVSGGVIARKESIASATSTQTSEMSGTDQGVDSTGQQGDSTGPPSTGGLSPRGTITVSQETARRLVVGESNPTVHVEALLDKYIPVPAQSEQEFESRVPVPLQQQQHLGYDLQHTGVAYPPPGPYLQAFVDPRQGTLNRAEYAKVPSPMGFPSQILGTVGPIYGQQQYHDSNAVGVSSHQFIPAMHMTMTPSSHVSFHPNAVPQVVQQQQEVRLERYPEECTYGQRFVPLSSDQSYSTTYHAQVPSQMVSGPYGWNQAPHPEQLVAFSESRVIPQQQVMYSTETVPRYEGCFMCQKALPHAHSDTLAHERKESPTATVADMNSIYHSIRLEESRRAMQPNRVVVTGEGTVESKGVGTSPTAQGQYVVSPNSQGQFIVSPTGQGQYGNDRIIIQRAESPEQSKVSLPQNVVGFAGVAQPSYGVLMNTVPHTGPETVVQAQQLAPAHYQLKQDTLVNHPISSDFSPVGIPSPTSDHQSPRDNSGKLPVTAEPCFTYDNLRQIDCRMENLRIRPQDVFLNSEQSISPIEQKAQKEEVLLTRPLHVAGRELNPDSSYGKPLMVVDTNLLKQNEMLPCSTEVTHLHGYQPREYEMAQQALFGGPDHPHPMVAINNLSSSDASTTGGVSPVSEWKDYPSQSEPRMVITDIEPVTVDPLAPFSNVGETQDTSNSLFSNQDPWNLRHDIHFPPPRPNKILTKKEIFGTKDAFGDNRPGSSGESPTSNIGAFTSEMRFDDVVYQPSANLDTNINVEHGHSNKGSAEEQIKQELQAVAEGVAASVLQAPNPDLAGNVRGEYSLEAKQNGEFQYNNAEMQHSDKPEDVKTKLPEKPNVAFPVSDGLGRLQIINNVDLEELRELGSGTFGTVYHGKWRGSDVAIKRINDRCFAGKASEQERMREDFWNEAIKLADLHHPNVVAFYGVVLDGPGGSVATVTEYMVNGSLRNALQRNERNLDKRKRLLIAMDVAFGMEYLHGKNIVHFDLKSDNLLVNLRDPHRPICKVGDLGLSKVKCQTLISGGVRGTLPWMAPELLNGSSSLVSEKVDVFSFGIVMWELLTGDEPYADLHYGAIIGGIVSNTLRPPVPEFCDAEWRLLMERCWSAEPSERPNFTEIANHLRTMAARAPPKTHLQS